MRRTAKLRGNMMIGCVVSDSASWVRMLCNVSLQICTALFLEFYIQCVQSVAELLRTSTSRFV